MLVLGLVIFVASSLAQSVDNILEDEEEMLNLVSSEYRHDHAWPPHNHHVHVPHHHHAHAPSSHSHNAHAPHHHHHVGHRAYALHHHLHRGGNHGDAPKIGLPHAPSPKHGWAYIRGTITIIS